MPNKFRKQFEDPTKFFTSQMQLRQIQTCEPSRELAYLPISAEDAQMKSDRFVHHHTSCVEDLASVNSCVLNSLQFDVPTNHIRTTILDSLRLRGFTAGQPDLLLQIVQGDITRESTDAIATSTTQFLEFKSGVSAALLDKGGEIIA